MVATLKPGKCEVIEVLHPEYESTVSRWRVRCGQCGRQGELIGAWSPPPMYRCLECSEFNWRITQQQRIMANRCAHCDREWNVPKPLAMPC